MMSALTWAQPSTPSTLSVGGETTPSESSSVLDTRVSDNTNLTSLDLEAQVSAGEKSLENDEMKPRSVIHYRVAPTPTVHPNIARPVPVIPGTILPAMRNVLPRKPTDLAGIPTPATSVVPASSETDLENQVSQNSSIASKNRERVYATLDGRFHKRECRFAREALPLSRGEAIAKDLKPCPFCRP